MLRVKREEGHPMGRTRIKVALLGVFLVVGAGVMAVQASPQCQKFVKTFVTTPVRNRVSKATEIAWAKWRVEHPNWKPKPGVTRPKYKMSRQEALDKVAFACEVPTTPSKTDMFFTPADFEVPPVIANPPTEFMETTQLMFPDLIPPVVSEFTSPPISTDIPAIPGIFIPPYVPPVFSGRGPINSLGGDEPPVTFAETPEPASFFLMTVGMAGAWFLWLRRERSVELAVARNHSV
jgi:PEP-CTERM motif